MNSQFDLKSIDSIVFYDFKDKLKSKNISIVENGMLNSKIIKNSFKLNNSKFKEFNNTLFKKSSFGKGTAFCFDPHLGIVYFKKGQPLYYNNICFSCNILRANFDIPNQKKGKQGEGDKIYYLLDGMNKKFRKYLNDLIAKYNFGNQISKESMFDK